MCVTIVLTLLKSKCFVYFLVGTAEAKAMLLGFFVFVVCLFFVVVFVLLDLLLKYE